MAAPDPYAGTDEAFDPSLHWGNSPAPANRSYTGQKIGSESPEGDAFFSQENAEAAITGVIDAKRIRGFARYCLGYNNMTTASVYNLQRTNPICHPRYTGLVCNGVAIHEFRSARQGTLPIGQTSRLQFPRNDDTTGVVCVTEGDPGTSPHSFEKYAGYDKAHVTVRFTPSPYRFLPDGSVPLLSATDGAGSTIQEEWYRNTIIDTEPRTELLTLSGFQLIYCEGSGNTAPITDPYPKVSPGDLGQILIKPDLKVTWHRVPEKFISKNTIPGQVYPEKIVKGLGKVNKYKWQSWPKGTLLLVGAHLVRKPWSLAAGIIGGVDPPFSVRESMFNYDIELLFSFFDPPKGYKSNALIVDGTGIGTGTTGADTHGHNCLPYRGEPTGAVVADDKNAGKWFMATYSGSANYIGNSTEDASPGARTIYEYAPIANLFNSVWNSDIT